MSFDFATSIHRDKGIFTTSWTWWPTDTLDALDLFLVYFGLNKGCVRKRLVAPIRRDSALIKPHVRCLHDKAYRSATCLVHPTRRCPEKRQLMWYVISRDNVKRRLAGAGISIDTVEIIDERRWAFTWQQLTTGNIISYKHGENEKLFQSEFPTPVVSPVVKHVTCIYKKGQPSKVQYSFEKRNNYVYTKGKRSYRPDISPNSTDKGPIDPPPLARGQSNGASL